MPRKKINLRMLPVWLQYVISLIVVTIIVTIAWWIGRDDSVPMWITRYLVPILYWSFIALLVISIASYILKKSRAKQQASLAEPEHV